MARVDALTVRGVRNLADQEWQPGAGVQLLLGGTGAGKTSLLEALYIVATTRSFRAQRLADVQRREGAQEAPTSEQQPAEGLFVRAEVHDVGRRTRLETGWSRRAGLVRSVNGDSSTLAEHLAVLPVLCWTSADSETLTGEPELRRRLMDRGVVNKRPLDLELLGRYRTVLQHKRGLLEQRGGGLEAWNGVFASAASALVAARAAYVADLERAFSGVLAATSLGWDPMQFEYQPSPREALDGEEALLAALEAAAGRERDERRPLLGPHRDRLKLVWKGEELRRVASAGERKGIGLLLLAAQARLLREAQRTPIHLLDDADTELDRDSLEALWQVVTEADQTFVTSNRGGVWKGLLTAQTWRVEKGRISGE